MSKQDLSLDDIWLQGRILSLDPLVTISSAVEGAPAGFASFIPELIGDRPGLHLLHHVWTLEQGNAGWIAEGVRSARAALPGHDFIMLASDSDEVLAYTACGERCMVASALTMLDERVWRPMPPDPRMPLFDAAYVARLDTMKRHELAAEIDRVLLIYGYPLEADHKVSLNRTRELLPRATLANHEAGNGNYAYLNATQVATLLAQSGVGLCLSAVEGCMRASMEYLLCGLPVVSTKSVGGRDRYLGTGYCRIVEDDPGAIAQAAKALKDLNLDRNRIRAHVAEIIGFERYNFLLTINKVMRKHFGLSHDLFPTIEPFLGSLAVFERASAHQAKAKQKLLGHPQPV